MEAAEALSLLRRGLEFGRMQFCLNSKQQKRTLLSWRGGASWWSVRLVVVGWW